MLQRQKILFATAVGFSLVVAASLILKSRVPDREAAKSQDELISPEKDSLSSDVPLNKSVTLIPSAATNSLTDRIIELTKLAGSDDQESFQTIMASLSDEEPDIRQAALETAIQLGNRDAIPILKELAEKTKNAQEKSELLEAAKYLELPSLKEIQTRRRTNSGQKATARPPN